MSGINLIFWLTIIISQVGYIISTVFQSAIVQALASFTFVQYVTLLHLKLFSRIQQLDNQPAFFSYGNLFKTSVLLLFLLGELLAITIIWKHLEPQAYLASMIAPAVPILLGLFVTYSYVIYIYIADFINSKDITVLDVIFGIKNNSSAPKTTRFSFGESREAPHKLNKISNQADEILRDIAQCKTTQITPNYAEDRRQNCNKAATKREEMVRAEALDI